MIGVIIHINRKALWNTEALNISKPKILSNEAHTYKVYGTGEIIKHVRNKGSIKLAIKMLQALSKRFPNK